jgi:hypothetical protein
MQPPVNAPGFLPNERLEEQLERKLLPLQRLRQKGPSCGTTSLAMALNALAQQLGKPRVYTQASLDKGHRLPFMFSSPQLLVNIARKHGFYAQAYNTFCETQLKEHLYQGHLVLALGCTATGNTPSTIEPFSWHWRLVHGYDNCCNPNHTDYSPWAKELNSSCVTAGSPVVLVSDPHGFSLLTPFETFTQTFFKPLAIGLLPTSIKQCAVVVSNQNTLPPTKPLPWVLNAIHGFGNVIQWLPHQVQKLAYVFSHK